MLAEIGTVCFQGICAIPITVQVHLAGGGLPSFSIVGLADKAVNESRERIRAALHTLGIALPARRITMNLAPANIQKEGSHYDLPLALGLLGALGAIPLENLGKMIALGELALDGTIKEVRGALSAAILAAAENKTLICPEPCGAEAAWGGEIQVLAPNHLKQLMAYFKNAQDLPMPLPLSEISKKNQGDLGELYGQASAKRALTVAAAGRHNMIMSGPPGAGKSMLASRVISILPYLEPAEALEVTMIHSLAGTLKEGRLMRTRPFRQPHQSVSMPALVGGGVKGMPGEISLAHRGVLFLDELPEFSRVNLEALRQSMQNRHAVVSRVNYRAVYPADFQLIAAMNPCRCGYLGDLGRQCHKAPTCGKLYRSSLSGPFLDRIDLCIEVPKLNLSDLAKSTTSSPESPAILRQIENMRHRQIEEGLSFQPNPEELSQFVHTNDKSLQLLLKACEKFGFSARSYYRTIHVARTISFLDYQGVLHPEAMAEALSYRIQDF